jgi:8-oxo-dGTP pyrophosphatase MutT (NUDIX family)
MAMPKRLHEVGQLIVACETYIVHNGKVLMHKRAENKSKFPGFWIGPGGHVDEGEDVLSAAIREIYEETGVILEPSQVTLKVLAFHHHLDRGEVWMEYLFRAEIPAEQSIHSTAEGLTAWLPIEEVLTMDQVFPPSKYYLGHILNSDSGIMYNASEWQDAQLVKVLSEHLG